ncbi:hypothetical protein QTP70_033151 [Hemibagrus guttatus]|uniref:Centrosomal protein 57kDa-like protein 1 n=1 Tax=Hemibagrus guttatus TaxID=175788 RepID=A0AAE0UHI0_9TELE|nr:hypothetical protein QTP70_033151 [Hemibagrus guttatus]KAK3522564.1 hypothetical protein QTP86_023276 [Hemibagrus guttatus]
MDRLRDWSLCLDSPSKNSYVGSFYAPPDRMTHQNQHKSSNTVMRTSRPTPHSAPDTGSRAVIAALKSLQEKMRRLELERLQAEKNVEQFAQAARQCGNQTSQQLQSRDGESSKRKELVSQLHSAEARCSLLEKQLEYMRKLVESAQREKPAPVDGDREEKKNKQPAEPQIQAQLQKLEEQSIKITNTQSEVEMKIKLLERKLLEEEHKRKLVQEKAEELQRELEANLLCSAAEEKPKKKTKKTKEKTMIKKPANPEVPRRAFAKRMPFVAGTSTSPSHSVNANVQTVLHLLKTRQPRLCERTESMRGTEPKRSHRASQSQSDGAAAMGSLSDLLLALQDELGHMSLWHLVGCSEHQELVRQIDETDQRKLREDLERELDCLVRRMEEKAAQITKLRKHQQTVRAFLTISIVQMSKSCPSAAQIRSQGRGEPLALTESR